MSASSPCPDTASFQDKPAVAALVHRSLEASHRPDIADVPLADRAARYDDQTEQAARRSVRITGLNMRLPGDDPCMVAGLWQKGSFPRPTAQPTTSLSSRLRTACARCPGLRLSCSCRGSRGFGSILPHGCQTGMAGIQSKETDVPHRNAAAASPGMWAAAEDSDGSNAPSSRGQALQHPGAVAERRDYDHLCADVITQ